MAACAGFVAVAAGVAGLTSMTPVAADSSHPGSVKSLNIDLETATIQQLHQLLVTNKLTAVRLSQMYLQRIADLNSKGPSLTTRFRVIKPDR